MHVGQVPDPAASPAVAAIGEFDLAMTRFRAEFAEQCGIHVNDSLILTALLIPEQQHRPRDLAERLGVTSGSLTAMLDRLEVAGLVRREPHPTDRRSLHVSLTDLGVQRLAESRDRMRGLVEGAVPARSRDPFVRGLHQMTEALVGWLDSPGPS